ncbi:MAG: hypothetical protein ABG776_12595, partial [Cyanobacteria bacterium J06555_13]
MTLLKTKPNRFYCLLGPAALLSSACLGILLTAQTSAWAAESEGRSQPAPTIDIPQLPDSSAPSISVPLAPVPAVAAPRVTGEGFEASYVLGAGDVVVVEVYSPADER